MPFCAKRHIFPVTAALALSLSLAEMEAARRKAATEAAARKRRILPFNLPRLGEAAALNLLSR